LRNLLELTAFAVGERQHLIDLVTSFVRPVRKSHGISGTPQRVTTW
jgi:hypothetical protein